MEPSVINQTRGESDLMEMDRTIFPSYMNALGRPSKTGLLRRQSMFTFSDRFNDEVDSGFAISRPIAPPPSPQEPSMLDSLFGASLSAKLQAVSVGNDTGSFHKDSPPVANKVFESSKEHALTLDKLLRRTITQQSRGVMKIKSKKPVTQSFASQHGKFIRRRRTRTRPSRIPLSMTRIQQRSSLQNSTNELVDAISMVQITPENEQHKWRHGVSSPSSWRADAIKQKLQGITEAAEKMDQLKRARGQSQNSLKNSDHKIGSVETIIHDLHEMGL
ncbi:hypothetical protein CLU79DRAFT_742945 [Phycomyces nitens]|nr:hypothetical protein CLU79DRAFT_742945 [Phycomyces nitens]